MQRIDEAAIHTIGIPRVVLMDAAGLATASAVRRLLPSPDRVLVCCGSGYNGGDGLCAAWHLLRWAYQPTVVLAGDRQRLKEDSAVYAGILEHLGVAIHQVADERRLEEVRQEADRAALIVDALLGIGRSGAVRPLYARLIEWINQAGKPVVAVDVPSGLDADTGLPMPIAVRATMTVTFGAAKQGLLTGQGPAHTGTLVVEDIGLPMQQLALSS